jgi:hypothetical protein
MDECQNGGENVMTEDERNSMRFQHAFMALHERHDVKPLLGFLRSSEPLTPTSREALAGLLSLWDELIAECVPSHDGQPRKPRGRGAPGGKHQRWNMSNYVAAFMVESWRGNGRTTAENVNEVIREMKGWVWTKERRWIPEQAPLDKDRILHLLKGSKRDRL